MQDVCSDRGAETHDYPAMASESRTTSAADNAGSKKEVQDKLDAEFNDYLTKTNDSSRKSEAIQTGRKRSVKDRLGKLEIVQKSSSDLDIGQNKTEDPSVQVAGKDHKYSKVQPKISINL